MTHRPTLTVLTSLAGFATLAACRHLAADTEPGTPVVESDHVVVRSLPIRLDRDDRRVLPLVHVAAREHDWIEGVELFVWNDLDGDREPSAGEAKQHWGWITDDARTDFVAWRDLKLPPGDRLHAWITVELTDLDPFEAAWPLDEPQSDSR